MTSTNPPITTSRVGTGSMIPLCPPVGDDGPPPSSSSSSSSSPGDDDDENIGPYYSQGLNTYRVPMSLYRANRLRLIESIKAKIGVKMRGIIFLEGGKQTTRYDTDHEPVFRQESYFHYLFGNSQYSDCYGLIILPEGRTVLFVPTWGIEVATVCGPCPDFEYVKAELGVDDVMGVEDVDDYVMGEMSRMNDITADTYDDADRPKLYLLKGMNTDSGNYAMPAHFVGIEKYDDVRDETTLFDILVECRVTKVRKCVILALMHFVIFRELFFFPTLLHEVSTNHR
jgi:Xaa-Pro dipeptidase